MKILTSVLLSFLTMIFTSCNLPKKNSADPASSVGTKNLAAKIEKIELTEQSRGVNRLYTFTKKEKTTTLNGSSSTLAMPVSEWDKICTEVNLLNLTTIENLESPTTGRFSDAALSSDIVIYIDGKTYHSASFDAGIPNEKLKALYNALKDPSGTILQKSKNTK
ncbi:hypothetical protein [Chryseobacterium sp. JAH]|uniref:hypothetical protein n=1 Tax=Chryseobacterium sp. JAH TaxID=1742858 RepID=UPI00064813A3|nr:hypothetical protein [Chryseobacterium sp. JAH]KUJ50432.1 hypothetical protein AR685_14100 [Chryseobacterium sp. JAH]